MMFGTRIKLLESVDQDLLLSAVYVEMFRLLLKFIGILTRYVRNQEFSMQPTELTNF